MERVLSLGLISHYLDNFFAIKEIIDVGKEFDFQFDIMKIKSRLPKAKLDKAFINVKWILEKKAQLR